MVVDILDVLKRLVDLLLFLRPHTLEAFALAAVAGRVGELVTLLFVFATGQAPGP